MRIVFNWGRFRQLHGLVSLARLPRARGLALGLYAARPPRGHDYASAICRGRDVAEGSTVIYISYPVTADSAMAVFRINRD